MKAVKKVFEESIRELKQKESKKPAKRPVDESVEMRYREKPHRFEVKDQKVIIRLRKWQKEMNYDEFSDTELLVLMTRDWIDKHRAEKYLLPSGYLADNERIHSG